MKILHYISDFSLPSETFIYDLIMSLENRKKISNVIITNRRHLQKERPFHKIYLLEYGGVNKKIRTKKGYIKKILKKIHYIVTKNIFLSKIFYKGLQKNFEMPQSTKFLDILKKEKPDVIYAHFGPNGIRVNNLLKENNKDIPLIIHFHGTDLTSLPYRDKVYAKNLKELSKRKNLICLVNSNFLKDKLIKQNFPKKRIKVVYNTYNPLFLKNKKEKFFKKGETFKIINISRFVNWKGHKYLVDAFKKFLQIYPKSKLTLVGEGKKKENIIRYSKRIGIFDKVDFKGVVSHKKIPSILRQHDVYVQPSIQDKTTHQEESFGVVLLEAIASGLPVIITNTGGMPEIVGKNNKFSFIIKQKNSLEIYKTLKYLIGDKYDFSSNDVYAKRILEKFSQKNFLKKILFSIKKLVRRKK